MLLRDRDAWCSHSCRRGGRSLWHLWVRNLLRSHWHRMTCCWYWHLLLMLNWMHLLLLYQMLLLHNWMRRLLLGQVMLLLLIQVLLLGIMGLLLLLLSYLMRSVLLRVVLSQLWVDPMSRWHVWWLLELCWVVLWLLELPCWVVSLLLELPRWVVCLLLELVWVGWLLELPVVLLLVLPLGHVVLALLRWWYHALVAHLVRYSLVLGPVGWWWVPLVLRVALVLGNVTAGVLLLVRVLQLQVGVLLLELLQVVLRVHGLLVQALPSFVLLEVTPVGHVQELLVAEQTVLVCVSLLENVFTHALHFFIPFRQVGLIVTGLVDFLHL